MKGPAVGKYRPRPVEVEAIQLTRENLSDVAQWVTDSSARATSTSTDLGCIAIHALDGELTARIGDYVVLGPQGGFFPCKPDVFQATYEPAK